MSKKQRARRTMRVQIPGVNMNILRGDGKMDENQSALDKRRDAIVNLDLQADELDAEARVTRRRREVERLSRGDEAPPQEQGSTLGDKLVEQVIIPMVNDRLKTPERGRQGDSVALRALNLLEKERAKGRDPPKSAVSSVSEVIGVFNEIRGLVDDKGTLERMDKMQKSIEEIAEGKKRGNMIDEYEGMMNFVDSVKKNFNLVSPGGTGDSDALIAHQRWAKEFEAKEKTRDRAWNLRLRQVDKKHDLDLAKLGVEQERNDLLAQGIKRIGDTFVEAVLDDDDLDEGLKGRKIEGSELMKIHCPTEDCDTMLTIPPEGQVLGATIRCPICKETFETYEKE